MARNRSKPQAATPSPATPETPAAWPADVPTGTRLVPLWLFVAKMHNSAFDAKRDPLRYAYEPGRRMIRVLGTAIDAAFRDVGELPPGFECATVDFIQGEEDFVGDPEAIAELRRRQDTFDDAYDALCKILNA